MKYENFAFGLVFLILFSIIGTIFYEVGCFYTKNTEFKAKCLDCTISYVHILNISKGFSVGDTVFIDGNTYILLELVDGDEKTPQEHAFSLTNQERDFETHNYQLDVHMDTIWLYDADRFVGISIDSTLWNTHLGKIIMKDNN